MIFQFIIVIFGLCLFEIISSIDNAIINAHVLKTLPDRFRRIFLVWGLLIAVFIVRGILPFIIVWIANPGLSFGELFSFIFSQNPAIEQAVETSKPLLMLGGGIYLFFVFLACSWKKRKWHFWSKLLFPGNRFGFTPSLQLFLPPLFIFLCR